MKASVGAAVAASALAAAVIWPVHGAHAALVTAAIVAVVSCAGLGVAHAAARRGSSAPLRRRFALTAAIAAGVILLTVLAAAALMFVSDHDALLVAAIVLAAAAVALRAAHVAAGDVIAEVGAMRDLLVAVGRGERDSRAHAAAAAELTELAGAANTMIERLASEESRRDVAEAARRDLVAAISHDLRTPLTALRLMAEAMEDRVIDDDATRSRYLTTMRTHVAALGAMIDDLFELSRLEAGDLEWSMQTVQVGELVDATVGAMRVEAEAKGVAVATELAPLPKTTADPEKLQRVLFNLIQNAIRHTPADGSVTVRAAPAGTFVEVEVTDTGAGIPAADRERIFEPFVRADPARGGGGAGLGLAIARAIVERHGGRIWLADSDAGTSIRFVIPV